MVSESASAFAASAFFVSVSEPKPGTAEKNKAEAADTAISAGNALWINLAGFKCGLSVFAVVRIAGERNDVANVLHSCYKQHKALEAEAKA